MPHFFEGFVDAQEQKTAALCMQRTDLQGECAVG